MRRNAYVLMRDKKGWKSLARNLNNLNNTEYMRVARGESSHTTYVFKPTHMLGLLTLLSNLHLSVLADLPEVDVPKGTLVEVDVEESFVRKSVGLQNRFVLKEDPIQQFPWI